MKLYKSYKEKDTRKIMENGEEFLVSATAARVKAEVEKLQRIHHWGINKILQIRRSMNLEKDVIEAFFKVIEECSSPDWKVVYVLSKFPQRWESFENKLPNNFVNWGVYSKISFWLDWNESSKEAWKIPTRDPHKGPYSNYLKEEIDWHTLLELKRLSHQGDKDAFEALKFLSYCRIENGKIIKEGPFSPPRIQGQCHMDIFYCPDDGGDYLWCIELHRNGKSNTVYDKYHR
jgi:hypothetical protein